MGMSEKKIEEMRNALEYHKPSAEKQLQIEAVRAAGIQYMESVAALLSDSRGASEWWTNFQHAQMFAIWSLVETEPVQARGCIDTRCNASC